MTAWITAFKQGQRQSKDKRLLRKYWRTKAAVVLLITALILPGRIDDLSYVQAATLAAQEHAQAASKQIMIYQQGSEVRDHRLIVRLADGADPFAIADLAGATVERTGPFDFATLTFTDQQSLDQGLAILSEHPGVLSAEQSKTHYVLDTHYVFNSEEALTAPSTSPSSSASSTSSAVSVSDKYYKEQWALPAINAPEAWNEGATGKGIIVAVVDTGVAYNHPDLTLNVIPGYNAITGKEGYQAAADDHGHGTNVAGVIAAALDGQGIVGVAPEASIMPIKTMNAQGNGSDDIIASGIVWAVDHGARIINMSLGSDSQTSVLTEAIRYATDRGVLVIAASGNKGRDTASPSGISFPGADPHVLAVSAVDEQDRITEFSLTGPDVALSAPGYNILTTDWNRGRNGYAYTDGTSIAAPFVAGAAALVWSKYPDLEARDVRILLERSSKDLGLTGRDSSYGYGRINPYWAIKFAEPTEELSSPAVIDWTGGTVVESSSQGGAHLSIPAKAFGNRETDRTTVTLAETEIPQEFSGGIFSSSPAFLIQWGEMPAKRMVTLTLDGEIPADLTNPAAYVYRWSGSRWLRVGGGTLDGKVSVGIYQPGIYRLGFEELAEPQRLAGEDRIETAIAIAKETFPTGADTVILARSDAFPDALAGVSLAYKYQAPILLTSPNILDERTWAAIQALKPRQIYLLGGTEAISDNIRLQLSSIASVKRIGGSDRYDTAARIAAELGSFEQAVIVNGLNFPDALSAASVSAIQGIPILLTSKDTLVFRTSQVLREQAVTETIIIGERAVVGEVAEALLPDPIRIGGADRYATAAAVLQAYPPQGHSVYLATGNDFPDALAGGVLAAVHSSNILLVPNRVLTNLDQDLIHLLQGKAIRALGGEQAVPETVLSHIRAQLNSGGTEVLSVF